MRINERRKRKKIVVITNLAGNIFLFLIKIFAGITTGSVSLIADSLNSFSDILYSLITFIAVRMSYKKPDEDHPFGHKRSETIAGLIIGILVAVIGIDIAKEGIMKLVFGSTIQFGLIAVIVLIITICTKLFLWLYTKKTAKKTKSTALIAISKDCFSDILISFTALIGVIGATNNYLFLDPLMALLISVYIIWNGGKIALENSNQLIGKAPAKKTIEEIKAKALEVEGVKGVHDIKAQFLGSSLHVEIHIVLDEKLSVREAHSIGKNVKYSVESMNEVDKVFVHIDPFFQKRLFLE
jgi:cation diffusion facilitator family transporter